MNERKSHSRISFQNGIGYQIKYLLISRFTYELEIVEACIIRIWIYFLHLSSVVITLCRLQYVEAIILCNYKILRIWLSRGIGIRSFTCTDKCYWDDVIVIAYSKKLRSSIAFQSFIIVILNPVDTIS